MLTLQSSTLPKAFHPKRNLRINCAFRATAGAAKIETLEAGSLDESDLDLNELKVQVTIRDQAGMPKFYHSFSVSPC